MSTDNEPETVVIAGLTLTRESRLDSKRSWKNGGQRVFWTEEMGYIAFFAIGPATLSAHAPTLDGLAKVFDERLRLARDAFNACFTPAPVRPRVAVLETL